MRTLAILVSSLAMLTCPMRAQAPELEPPIRLRAGDELIDSGSYKGHSGPLLWDHDGDGLPDLLVGNLEGRIQVYRNAGSAEEPEFEDGGLLQAGGEDARVPSWWSIGASLRHADLDGDGRDDLLAGSFDGCSYVFRGQQEGGFAGPVRIVDGTGAPLRVGQYWDYEGRRWVEPNECLGISATPVDWDADGDPDLLLGTAEGRVFLSRNEGSVTEPAFSPELVQLEAGGRVLEVPGQPTIPVAADWDGDGRWDLVTGSRMGAVYWYPNVGEPGAPRFAAAVQLVPRTTEKTDEPGRHTKVEVADFDADGDLDLLVGDHRTVAGETQEEGGASHGWVWLYRRKGAGSSEPAGKGR